MREQDAGPVLAALAGQTAVWAYVPRGLCRCFGHLHWHDCPSRWSLAERRSGVPLRDLVHCPWRHRLRVPTHGHASVLVLSLLHPRPRRSPVLASHLGRPRCGDDDWPHDTVPAAAHAWRELCRCVPRDVSLGTGHRRHFPDHRIGLRQLVHSSRRGGRTASGRRSRPQRMGDLRGHFHLSGPDRVGTSVELLPSARPCRLGVGPRRHCLRRARQMGVGRCSRRYSRSLHSSSRLLVLAPLFVVAPGRERWKLLGSSVLVVGLLSLPFIATTSGRAIHAVLLGTGDSLTHGGTVLWETSLRGAPLTFFSRIVPILVSMAIAWWALRRLGRSS